MDIACEIASVNSMNQLIQECSITGKSHIPNDVTLLIAQFAVFMDSDVTEIINFYFDNALCKDVIRDCPFIGIGHHWITNPEKVTQDINSIVFEDKSDQSPQPHLRYFTRTFIYVMNEMKVFDCCFLTKHRKTDKLCAVKVNWICAAAGISEYRSNVAYLSMSCPTVTLQMLIDSIFEHENSFTSLREPPSKRRKIK